MIIKGITKKERQQCIVELFGLDKISTEEIRRQYVVFYPIVSKMGYGGVFRVFGGKLLREEAEYTLPIEETKKQICFKFNLMPWQFKSDKVCNRVEIAVIYPSRYNNTDLIIGAMDACGWSISTSDNIVLSGMRWKCLSFEPMFDNDVSSEARIEPFLYHWTPLYNYKSIKECGLEPRSESTEFKFPKRVHLIKGTASDKEKLWLGRQLFNKNKNPLNDGMYVLISVDLKMVPKDVEIVYDPRYEWGYYTKKLIPKEALTFMYVYDFIENKQHSIYEFL